MDPEPGRCKRTDGRKWRCSKNVVPLQKYCERHMHRGRQGSRKHVEPTERVSRHDTRTLDGSRTPVMSLVASTEVDDKVGPSQPHSNDRSGFQEVLKCRGDTTLFRTQKSADACDIGNGISSGVSVDYSRNSCSSSRASYSSSGGDRADDKCSFDDAKPISICSRKQNVVGSNIVGFTPPRLGLSPNSVLITAGKVGLGSDCTTIMEVEPQRCRRTDGKKWQCGRDTLPNQKYCQTHMHRGAKRHGANPDYSRNFRAHASCTVTRDLNRGINLNTIPSSPQHAASNDSSSTTSDATGISDENISFCLGKLSSQ